MMGAEYYRKENRVHTTHHWHTYEPNLINPNGWVLDLGCNDFIISRHFLSMGLKVIGIEPIKNLNVPSDLRQNKNYICINKACVGIKESPTMTYYEYSAWGANSLYNPPEKLNREINGGHGKNPFKEKYEVELVTIQEIMQTYSIDQFEFMKIDVEGAEYKILENLPKKCAKQFSVEFHAFLDLTPSPDVEQYHKDLVSKLDDYFVSYEQLEPLRGSSEAWQRDDTLFVLKEFL